MASAQRAILLVHGTNDDSTSDDEGRWWQSGSEFMQQLAARCHEVPTDVIPFRWGGPNSERKRRDSALQLAARLEGLSHDEIFILAHSHGGNVVRRAMELCSPATLSRISSIVTVACPYFQYARAKSGVSLEGIAGVITLLLASSFIYFAIKWMPYEGIQQFQFATLAALFVGAFAVHWSASLLRTVGRWTSQLATVQVRLRRTKIAFPPRWVNIASPNDEAIILLNFVARQTEFLRQFISASPPAANEKWTGPSMAALAIAASLLVLITVALSSLPVWQWPPHWFYVVLGIMIALPAIVIAWWLLRSFLMFVKVLFDLPGNTTRLIATRLDTILLRRLRSTVFGDDCGAGIVGVALTPWPDVGISHMLPPELHIELEELVAASYSPTTLRIRRSLSGTHPLEARDWGEALKQLSWEELAHTACFKSRAVCGYVLNMLLSNDISDLLEGNPKWTARLRKNEMGGA